MTQPSAFTGAIDLLFTDPNIGQDAIFTPAGGAPLSVRIVARRADDVTPFGEARLWSETTRVDLRTGEVPNPRPGDTLTLGEEVFTIQGEPVRDRERLVWTIDMRQG